MFQQHLAKNRPPSGLSARFLVACGAGLAKVWAPGESLSPVRASPTGRPGLLEMLVN
jgi:hypothetical protein